MILVALLTGDALDDAGAAQLAADLGAVAYEARMLVAAGYPAIVLTMADASRAYELVEKLKAHGGDAVACDAREVIASEAMVALDKFTLEANGAAAGGETLAWSDVLCLLRASHRQRSATVTTTTERKFDAGRFVLSGGISNTKTVTKETKETSESREQVIYIFRASGRTPWILREQGTHYEGLGPALGRTKIENFATTLRLLREHAPHAAYDERLVSRARVAERSIRQGTTAVATVTTSSTSGIDVLAHFLACSIARERGAR